MIDGQAKVNLMQVGLICLLTVFFIIKCFQYLWNLGWRERKKTKILNTKYKKILQGCAFTLFSLQGTTENNCKDVDKKKMKYTILAYANTWSKKEELPNSTQEEYTKKPL